MARNGTHEDGIANTTQGHNAKVRKDLIVAFCNELAQIDSERGLLNERRKEITGRIKADLGMKVGDFMAAYRLYNLEDERRTEYLDVIREAFDALGVGMQGSLFPSNETAKTDTAAAS